MFIVAWSYDGKLHCPHCKNEHFPNYDAVKGIYDDNYNDSNVIPVFAYDYMKRNAKCSDCGISVKWSNSQ